MKIKRFGWLVAGAVLCVGLLRWTMAQQPVGHWPLDEGTGTNTVDVSGNNATGALVGAPAPVWTSGVSSNALGFDGAQNEVQVPDAPSLTPTNALTLMAWVRTATNLTSDVLGKWSTNEVAGSYILGLTNGWVKLELMLNDQPVTVVGAGASLSSTNWQHIAGTYDGTQMVVYVNGQAAGNQAASGTVAVATNEALRIGLLSGQLDDVRIYDQSLSSNVIAAVVAVDSDGDGMPDQWEASHGLNPNDAADASADPDLDGLTNLQEYQQGTDPQVLTPSLAKLSGDNQAGTTNAVLCGALAVKVHTNGVGLADAPVTFTVKQGGGLVSSSPAGSGSSVLYVQADGNGEASVWLRAGPTAGANLVEVSAGDETNTLRVTFTATAHAGLVGWWKLDETSGSVAADATGQGGAGQLVNGGSWEMAVAGNGLRVASNQWVSVADACRFNPTNQITVATWMNPARYGTSAPKPFLGKGDGATNGWALSYNNSGRVIFRMGIGNMLTNSAALPSNMWVQVVATFDGSTARLYINGALDASKAWSGARGVTTNAVMFGSASSSGFVGALDDVRLYDVAINSSEVQQLYWSQPLRGWWKLDEDSGTTAADSSGQENHGTLINDPAWVEGVFSNGLQVSTNQSVSIPHAAGLDLTNSITLSVWVMPTRVVGTGGVQFFAKGNSCSNGWGLVYTNAQKVAFRMTGLTNSSVISTGTAPTGQWTHVAATFDGKTAKLFLNGVLDKSATWTKPCWPNNDTVVLGGSGTTNLFEGALDDARAYGVPLTANAVYALYTADSDGDGMPDAWELNNGLDPFDPDDAGLDPDGDGLTNFQEFQIKTNPNKADSDNDGMPDNWEFLYGLNPNSNDANSDADNDRRTNLQEYQAGTNPKMFDTDADGYSDGQENTFGTLATDAASYPSLVPRNLLGWWKLDEGSGTNTLDASGHNCIGYLRNGPSWTAGTLGNALEFTGPTQYVSVAHWVPLSPLSNFTASVWVRPTTPYVAATHAPLFAKGDGWNKGWSIGLTNDTKVVFRVTGKNGNQLVSMTSLPTGQWTHVTATFSTNQAAIYLNGTLDTNKVWTGARTADTGLLTIGNVSNTTFQGSLDDARLYRTLLATNEIYLLYAKDADSDGMPDAWEWQYGLNAYYPDDAAMDYDGDGLTNLQEYQGQTDPWKYYNGVTPGLSILQGNNQGGITNAFLLRPLQVLVATNGIGLSNAPVVFAVTQGSAQIALTKDGPLVSSLTTNADANGVLQVWLRNPVIAETNQITATAGDGTNTASVLFTTTSRAIPVGMVAWWPVDEGTGTNTADETGYGADATLAGGITWTNGTSRKALLFDGVTGVVSTPRSLALDPATNALTICAWVNTTATVDQVVCSYRAPDTNSGCRVSYNANQIRFQWVSGDGVPHDLSLAGNLPAGQWTHVAATYGDGQATLYTNGCVAAVETNAGTGLLVTTNDTTAIWIGAGEGGATKLFCGRLDDVQVHERVLSTNELANLYWMDSDGDGMPDWWEADNGLDPNDPWDAALDPDGDGLINLLEYQHRGDPHNAHTFDGEIPDGWYVFNPGKNLTDYLQDAILRLQVYTPLEK